MNYKYIMPSDARAMTAKEQFDQKMEYYNDLISLGMSESDAYKLICGVESMAVAFEEFRAKFEYDARNGTK